MNDRWEVRPSVPVPGLLDVGEYLLASAVGGGDGLQPDTILAQEQYFFHFIGYLYYRPFLWVSGKYLSIVPRAQHGFKVRQFRLDGRALCRVRHIAGLGLGPIMDQGPLQHPGLDNDARR